ncbi:MAG: apolipoprotein N-acyltransferase [Candidatus Omnitrophota bacterium]|jgi:apolipoprotein N-acyltransferase|nr:apolipoprotein N-acyltransferase [Candidatus Omnitrophota bacterium]MDD5665294.1 apolipoprotein N-acyltransferase [Candidatus Omnitrophota bacterium]
MLRKITGIKAVEFWLCLFSALLLALPFLTPRFSLFAWFGFVPLFLALRGKGTLRSFILSYLTGIIFWAVTIFWLINVTLLGLILLVLYLALYFGLFGLLLRRLINTKYLLLIVPSLWVILEYARSHLLTGFPWSLLGYSQYLNLHIIQVSDITGVWGVSFLIVVVNTAVYSILISPPLISKKTARLFLFLILFLFFIVGYGYCRINLLWGINPGNSAKPVRLAVIQPNIPQNLKWQTHSRLFIMQRYFELTDMAVKDNPDLIIWPEAALPVVLEEEFEYFLSLRDYIAGNQRSLLFGSVTSKGNLYYNSALLISGRGELLSQYDKLHLVPFGEYIPFRGSLRFLDTIAPIGDIARGDDYTIFRFPDNFGVLICFEDVFPELARNFVKRGASFLVNITNDAWFGKTPEAYQHLAASVFRAVENRVHLVRCANTGVSAFISPSGKIVSTVKDAKGEDIFVQGYKTETIYPYSGRLSFYGKYGDFLPFFSAFLLLLGIIRGASKKRP